MRGRLVCLHQRIENGAPKRRTCHHAHISRGDQRARGHTLFGGGRRLYDGRVVRSGKQSRARSQSTNPIIKSTRPRAGNIAGRPKTAKPST